MVCILMISKYHVWFGLHLGSDHKVATEVEGLVAGGADHPRVNWRGGTRHPGSKTLKLNLDWVELGQQYN